MPQQVSQRQEPRSHAPTNPQPRVTENRPTFTVVMYKPQYARREGGATLCQRNRTHIQQDASLKQL
jgi:hypothetical protein